MQDVPALTSQLLFSHDEVVNLEVFPGIGARPQYFTPMPGWK
jgi:hypothetical protein